MVKKGERTARKVRVSQDAERLNVILIENFVSLQKAVTNLATKFDDLSDNITKLLQLFEISAKSFADKLASGVPDVEKDREFLEKLNKLLDQNKTIAKGLTLMEEKLRERLYGGHPAASQQPMMPRFQPAQVQSMSEEGYMPSSLGEKRTRELAE